MAVEAGIADYWYKYVGLKGAIVGMTGYGESAPADKLFPFFGFTAENIVAKAHKVLGGKVPDGDRRMLIAGCDADASYPAYSVLSGLHVPAILFNG